MFTRLKKPKQHINSSLHQQYLWKGPLQKGSFFVYFSDMKKYLIAALLVFEVCIAKAQTKPDSSEVFSKETEVFLPVDVSAEFPGGLEKFAQYIFKNLKYPEKAKEEKTQGKVFVSFVVEKDGSLTDIKIFKSVSPELDAEAIRLMKASPKWKPGMQGNNPVRQNYTLPIPFTLDN